MKLKFRKYDPKEDLPDIYFCLLMVKEVYTETKEQSVQFKQAIYSFNDECFWADGEKVIERSEGYSTLEILGYCVYDAMQLSHIIETNEDVVIDIPKSNKKNNSDDFFDMLDN